MENEYSLDIVPNTFTVGSIASNLLIAVITHALISSHHVFTDTVGANSTSTTIPGCFRYIVIVRTKKTHFWCIKQVTGLLAYPSVTLHSSISLQDWLSGVSSRPGGHSHLKLPRVFTHLPPLHNPGLASHSLISSKMRFFVAVFATIIQKIINVTNLYTHASLHSHHSFKPGFTVACKTARDVLTGPVSTNSGSDKTFVNI